MVDRVAVRGRELPRARGAGVRERTRRLRPLLAAGLALLATAAARPPASHGPAHAVLASSYVRTGPAASGAVLQWPGSSRSRSSVVSVAYSSPASRADAVAPLRRLFPADVLVVAPTSLPHGAAALIRKLPGVVAAQSIDAAKIKVNGKYVSMLGVDPSAFRAFAAGPTARSGQLWGSVAAGRVAVSYTMGRLDKLPLGGSVKVAGRRTESLRVGGFGTVGIPGIDAVVSESVARSLGLPAGNAIVVSAPHARLDTLTAQIKKLIPRPKGVVVEPLVNPAAGSGAAVATGAAGAPGSVTSDGPGLTRAELVRFLRAAESRVGLPYVWGAAGPRSFDCSGLVQWSLAQAGVVMPRVAVDQARTGPMVPAAQLQPGDLLFYHTDPTAPTYISHVAIYLGNNLMLQAPRPGLDVEIVPADTGAGFAGAVRVYPRVAAVVAGSPAG
jgi:peptidoglycan DL-endopeptidase CwlO